MEAKKAFKKIVRVFLIIIAILVLLWLLVFIGSKIRFKRDKAFLEEKGYCNLVTAGEYSVNVLSFGNENGKHRIIAMAGYGLPDSCITMRRMTAVLESDNQVIFIDRAGYGISDDTAQDMTVENIVEGYRTALKNAGIKAPYVLMPHSIGGVYATYWESKYPDEIEAVAIIDGTELEAIPPDEQDNDNDEAALYYRLVKCGIGGTGDMLLKHFLPPKEWLSDDEQKAEYAMALMTYDSRALLSESEQESLNINTAWEAIVTNGIPKIYISTAYFTAEDIEADGILTDEMIDELMSDRKELKAELPKTQEERRQMALEDYLEIGRDYKERVLLPYLEKLGNCELVSLPGDHLIYEQKPDECGQIIRNFIDGLDQ
ncbi:alpha/beta hydrolase [Ruminococcus sp.]|uniref:alpha/beta fold hydrolase n=1 Tax=Ruminococcus sp. TaxID=41978 RepID=UPI0025CE0527|nr:alpha/beta hydrolase [Ruminococcus sp.]MBQ8966214.1 alpha/beta hydrolase [Ruminococcus sp.]